VELDEVAEFGGGVSAEIAAIRTVQGRGHGVGELSGPALQIWIRLHNETPHPLPLDAVVVNLSYGEESVPSTPLLGDPSTEPFSGAVPAGGYTDAVYVFPVPTDAREDLRVTVSHASLSPIVAFEGGLASE